MSNYNIIKLNIIACSLISILFIGCASNKEINNLPSQLNCNRTVHFVWDRESNFAKTEMRGAHKDGYATFFKGKKLDYKEIFIESIEELNNKYNGKFLYKENHGFPSDSIIQVTVKIEKIVMNIGFSKIVRDTQLLYKVSGQEIYIIGSSSARRNKNLLQCLRHANLQFLLGFCNS